MPPVSPCVPIAIFGAPVDHVASDDDVAEEATSKVMCDLVGELVRALPRRERTVLIQRFGLFNSEPRTLREIAAVLDGGVSPATALACERRAIATLRSWLVDGVATGPALRR